MTPCAHSHSTRSGVLWPARLSHTSNSRIGGRSCGKVKGIVKPACHTAHAVWVAAASCDEPVGGSWLNMAESIERVLKRRALDGQHPHSPAEIGSWFEQTARCWNEQPTPFVWNGKRRQRRCRSGGDQTHRLGGSGACMPRPLRQNRATGASECQIQQQMIH